MKYFLGICLLITSLISSPVYSDAYDDCILKNMKGVTSDSAANAIVKACYNKHKKSKSTEKKSYYKTVCNDVTTTLQGNGQDSYWDNGYFVVTVSNTSLPTVWAIFQYRDTNNTKDLTMITAGNGQYVSKNSKKVFRIPERDIIYDSFTWNFRATYESCRQIKVQN